MGLSKRIRFEIFKRDSFTCQYCGRKAPDVVLHVDHIKPRAEGGTDDSMNLVTSCAPCNLGKGPRELDDASVLEKQRRQLEELQERREQLEMMVEWQRSLMDLDDFAVDKVGEFWCEMANWGGLSEHGRAALQKLITKWGADEVMAAMRSAAGTYFRYEGDQVTKESTEYAFDKISGICYNTRRWKKNPHLEVVDRSFYYFARAYSESCSFHPPRRQLRGWWDQYVAGPIEKHELGSTGAQALARELVDACKDVYYSTSHTSYWAALQDVPDEYDINAMAADHA